MKIKVLGSGCAKCKKLYESTQEVIKELNLSSDVEYVTDIQEILNMGLMSSPVLAIDGKPVFVGLLPEKEDIKQAVQKIISYS